MCESSVHPGFAGSRQKPQGVCKAEEEDAEVEFMDPGIGTGGAHGAGGSGDAQAAPEEEEYYDDEGADHDREDDEE